MLQFKMLINRYKIGVGYSVTQLKSNTKGVLALMKFLFLRRFKRNLVLKHNEI